MKAYLSYFKCELIVSLQYKTAAIAGMLTQFFWGILNAFVYQAFYQHASIDSINLKELMCYVWLNQAFLTLIFLGLNDNKINETIKDGTVAYELCKPYDLYWWWYLKHLAKRYAACFLRFLPVLIFAFLLPKPYNLTLPSSPTSFILFLLTLLNGSLVIVSIGMITQVISFFTCQDKGINNIVYAIGSLLSGFLIPIPLLPNIIINITEFLPFRLIGDLPFRLYSGNINLNYGIRSIILQLIWIFILIIIGKILMKKALKKVVIQGG